ncbi:MAG: helix-turn-helix transcriptional regulator [Clostridiales bacterium]|nr:helix-turn-helix transcriptional regulator [Clostridiales bacterium]
MSTTNFADKLYELLAEKGLNRKQFAEKCGIPYPTVIGWTNLNRLPDYSALMKLADFFDCSVDYLMCRQDDVGNITVVNSLTNDEEKLLTTYKQLTHAQKQAVSKLVESMGDK